MTTTTTATSTSGDSVNTHVSSTQTPLAGRESITTEEKRHLVVEEFHRLKALNPKLTQEAYAISIGMSPGTFKAWKRGVDIDPITNITKRESVNKRKREDRK